MSKPVLTKTLTTALNKTVPDLTIDLEDMTDRDGRTIGCTGSVIDATSGHSIGIDTAYRPRDDHQMAVLRKEPYAVMVPNTATFIARHVANIFAHLNTPESTQDGPA